MSIKKEIKNNLLERVLEENKINEFIRQYFKVWEADLLDIYESLLNSVFAANKWNEDTIQEILLILKESNNFLLDSIFSVFRPSDKDLQELLFKKLKLKNDSFENRGIISLSESVFSSNEMTDFFRSINVLVKDYENFEKEFFLKEINISQEVWDEVEEVTIEEFIRQNTTAEIDNEERKDMILTNKQEIERKTLQVLVWRYREELDKKLKNFFELPLQDTISREIEIISEQYINPKIEGNFITQALLHNSEYYTKKKTVYTKALADKTKPLSAEKKKTYEVAEKKLDTKAKSILSIKNKLEEIEKKESEYKLKIEKNFLKKKDRFIKSKVIGTTLYQREASQKIKKDIDSIFSGIINYDRLEGDTQKVLDFVITQQLVQKLPEGRQLPNVLDFEFTEKDKKGNPQVKKVQNKKYLDSLIDSIFKKFYKEFELIIYNELKPQDIFTYILKYQKNKKGMVLESMDRIEARLRAVGFFQYIDKEIRENINFQISLDKKVSQFMDKEKLLTPYDIAKEKARRIELFIKHISFLFIGEIYSFIDTKLYPKDTKELELLYGVRRLERARIKMRYDNLILSDKKSEYKNQVYQGFITQYKYLNIFWSLFLKDQIFFRRYLIHFIFLTAQGNIKKLESLFEEFKLISPREVFSQSQEDIIYLEKYAAKIEKEVFPNISNYFKGLGVSSNIVDTKSREYINNVLLDIQNESKITILYFINYVLITPNVELLIEESFLGVVVGNKIFIFFSSPSFEVLNQIIIYFENNHIGKERVFILCNPNFYFFLNTSFQSNVSLPGIQHEFKRLLEYSYYNLNVSDITIYGSKSQKTGYALIREDKTYNLVKFHFWSQSSSILLYKDIEKIIENIISLWWAITETKVVDGSIKVGWETYRLSLLRDGDRTCITLRCKPRGHPILTPLELRKKYNIEYENREIVSVPENVTLQQSYDGPDIELFQRLVLQDEGIFFIVWKTGSGKSVSIRNLLNYIFEVKVQENSFPKIVTMEDPIELQNLNFTQMQVLWSELLSFIGWLKRADPDYLLVWETRNYRMLLNLLEFSSMLWVTTTLHATSVLTTLDLLGQYAIQAEVSFGDVLRKTKCIISQKLLKIKKPKVDLDEAIEGGLIILYTAEEKLHLAETVFKEIFSNYIQEDIRIIELGNFEYKDDIKKPGLTRLLTAEEKKRRYSLWLSFKQDLQTPEYKFVKTISKAAKGVKLYYEFADQNFLKDNTSMFLALWEKDAPLKELEEKVCQKLRLKEEQAFGDAIAWRIEIAEYLTLSADLTPHVYDKLKKLKKI